jgi:hypothetical protein
MSKYFDYCEENDFFTWGGTANDLKWFVNSALETDEAKDDGEIKEDKKHNAVTFKLTNCSIRFYSTTNKLVLFGANQAVLFEKLNNIHRENKGFQPQPFSPTTQNNGVGVEGKLLISTLVNPKNY